MILWPTTSKKVYVTYFLKPAVIQKTWKLVFHTTIYDGLPRSQQSVNPLLVWWPLTTQIKLCEISVGNSGLQQVMQKPLDIIINMEERAIEKTLENSKREHTGSSRNQKNHKRFQRKTKKVKRSFRLARRKWTKDFTAELKKQKGMVTAKNFTR